MNSKKGEWVPIFAIQESKIGYYAPFMISLCCPPSAQDERITTQDNLEVNVMLIILSLYSSILALAVWQEKEGNCADC